MKSRGEKKQVIDLLRSKFAEAKSAVVVNYQGLKSDEMDELRKLLREQQVEFFVTKNSLVKIAAKDTDIDQITPLFKGPTSIALSSEDLVAPAKHLNEFAKEHNALKMLGGYLTGKVLSVEEVKFLAKLPSLDGMRAQFLSVLMGVPSKMARLINAYKEEQEKSEAEA